EETQVPVTPQSQPEVQAQPQAESQVNPIYLHYVRKYSLATQWNDYEVAKNALYDMIIENPGNDSLLFTLAYYYYENQQYAPSLLINQELLARQPKNLNYLEMAAVSAESLGVKDKALQNYETLYLLSNNVNTLYKISFLQFDMKRYNEALTNVDILLSKPEINTLKVYYNDAAGKQKEYIMKVSVLNLKGLIMLENGDKPGARKLFEEALKLAPDFVLTKENLAKTK
ncbi:MAG TPA: tetratricopeptide repeat protein, partial [Cyclobacteriaceae bacterium]